MASLSRTQGGSSHVQAMLRPMPAVPAGPCLPPVAACVCHPSCVYSGQTLAPRRPFLFVIFLTSSSLLHI
eukprot:scaffold68770_cov28-Tisochrysis_lutea.AAC.1